MANFRIFTEGKPDIKFLKDYIEEVFGIILDESDFDTLGSWAGYKAGGDIKASIKENQENKKETILIIDADNDFSSRQNEVLTDFAQFGTPVNLFLFPNNKNSGCLENLLCVIAIEQKILNCFNQYEECINGYESPVIKSRIFAYLDALLPSNKKKGDSKDLIQEKNRDYKNKAHWDLNHDETTPLKTFLQPFLNS